MSFQRKIECCYVVGGRDCSNSTDGLVRDGWYTDGKKYFCPRCAKLLMGNNKSAGLTPVDIDLSTTRRQIDPNRPDFVLGDDPNHAMVVEAAKKYD